MHKPFSLLASLPPVCLLDHLIADFSVHFYPTTRISLQDSWIHSTRSPYRTSRFILPNYSDLSTGQLDPFYQITLSRTSRSILPNYSDLSTGQLDPFYQITLSDFSVHSTKLLGSIYRTAGSILQDHLIGLLSHSTELRGSLYQKPRPLLPDYQDFLTNNRPALHGFHTT